MDSNKDFVNIDELFQQMREPIQEQYSSDAAWARFKHQLDEELPIADPVTGKGKRRYFLPLLALLLGTGTVGSAFFYSNHHGIGQKVTIEVPTAPQQTVAVNVHNLAVGKTNNNITIGAEGSANNDIPTAINKNTTLTKKSISHTTHSVTTASSHAANNAFVQNQINSNLIQNNKSTIITKTNNAVSSNADNNITESLPDIGSAALTATNDLIDPMSVKGIAIKDQNIAAIQRINQPNKSNHTHSELIVAQQPSFNPPSGPNPSGMIAELDPSTPIEEEAVAPATSNRNSSNSEFKERIVSANQTYVKDNNGQWFKEVPTPTTIVHKVNKVDPITKKIIIDTISNVHQTIAKYVPVSKETIAEITAPKADLVSLNSSTKEIQFTNLTALNDNQVKSFNKKQGGNFFKNYILRDDLLKLFNKNNKFEAMITFGGLYSPAATGAYGYSIGVGGLYNIMERLSIVLEAKYARKIFTNFYQEDLSKSYNVSQNGSLFSGSEEVTKYEYNIKNYNSIEIPLYLSYNIGDRLSIFGGVQYVYAAPIKWGLQKNTENNTYTSLVAPKPQQTIVNQQTDFGSRNGFGYLAGISFDASKKISVDFRVSQNFYRKDYTTNNVINGIYNAPVFSVTLGYYFGKKDKIYYLMQNKKR